MKDWKSGIGMEPQYRSFDAKSALRASPVEGIDGGKKYQVLGIILEGRLT